MAVVHKSILVDANFLVAMVNPKLSSDDRARVDHLFETVEKAKGRIVIPMPAVAEYLVGADIAGIETLNRLERRAHILMAPFDRAAAFECAQLDRASIGAGDKKDGGTAAWQKIKIDRQIVAIGKAHGATLVISGDSGVRGNALRIGMKAVQLYELELPASARQHKLKLDGDPTKK